MGQIGGVPCNYKGGITESDTADFPNNLWVKYSSQVISILHKMGAPARGKIAVCGGTSTTDPNNCSIYAITGSDRLGSRMDTGDEILTMLAAYVVIAAIADIIRAQVRALRDADPLAPSEELVPGLRPYISEAHCSAVRR